MYIIYSIYYCCIHSSKMEISFWLLLYCYFVTVTGEAKRFKAMKMHIYA